MAMLAEIFKKPKPIIGKVQLLPLPGAPNWEGQWAALTARAEQEATALATGGVDGLIIENFHDTPYTQGRIDTAGAIALAMLTQRLKQFTDLPIGVSILHNDPETALAVAMTTQASFIRLSVLSGALVTDSGIINSRFHELMQYKNRLNIALPPLLVDISTRHLTSAIPTALPESCFQHLVSLANALPAREVKMAVVLSDQDIEASEVSAFKASNPHLSVAIESNSQPDAVGAYLEQADALILNAGTRKNSTSPSATLPTIDMVRVEEMINRLRNVVPVTEMDPDIFLRR